MSVCSSDDTPLSRSTISLSAATVWFGEISIGMSDRYFGGGGKPFSSAAAADEPLPPTAPPPVAGDGVCVLPVPGEVGRAGADSASGGGMAPAAPDAPDAPEAAGLDGDPRPVSFGEIAAKILDITEVGPDGAEPVVAPDLAGGGAGTSHHTTRSPTDSD